MFGLIVKITAVLLFNIFVVQGNTYQKDDYLINEKNLEDYDTFYLEDGYDYESNVNRINYNVSKPIKKNQDFNVKINVTDRPKGRPYPLKKFYGLGKGSGKCRNFQGLPRPESGCCGVQLTRIPMGRFPGKPSWQPANHHSRSPDINNKRIRGGKATNLHQFPWMARLSIYPENANFGIAKSCGATIISSRYVLTAAHCVHRTYKNIKQLEVFLAEYDTSSYPKDCIGKKCIRNIVVTVDNVIKHPKFNITFLINDVALIRLSSEIPYTDFIRPICLPTVDIEELSEEVDSFIIAGWGLDGRIESDLKQAAFVKYVSNEECKAQYSYKDNGMFCSIGGHGEDICHGDSGGPLMAYHMDKYFLSGVVNGKRRDQECGSSVPSLFNNVFYHLDWITKYVH